MNKGNAVVTDVRKPYVPVEIEVMEYQVELGVEKSFSENREEFSRLRDDEGDEILGGEWGAEFRD